MSRPRVGIVPPLVHQPTTFAFSVMRHTLHAENCHATRLAKDSELGCNLSIKIRPGVGNIVTGVFTPVLAKHSKNFSLVDAVYINGLRKGSWDDHGNAITLANGGETERLYITTRGQPARRG